MAVTNPNGANATVSDPREQVCWDFYVEGLAKNGGNAYESAIKAGYAEDTARNITMNDWFKERLRKLRQKEMLSDAEKILKKTLNYSTEDLEGNVKVDLLRVQADVAKHVTKTLGKEDYSERSELTGKDGKDLLPKPILAYVIPSDESNEEGDGNEEAPPLHTGGNISE